MLLRDECGKSNKHALQYCQETMLFATQGIAACGGEDSCGFRQ